MNIAQAINVEAFWHGIKNLNEINMLNAGNKCRGFGNKCRAISIRQKCRKNLLQNNSTKMSNIFAELPANIIPKSYNEQKRSMVHSMSDQ